MLGNLPVTVLNKCNLLMLTCLLKTVKKKKKKAEGICLQQSFQKVLI